MVNTAYGEKVGHDSKEATPTNIAHDVEEGTQQPAKLSRGLQGRHMQMIAIGGHFLLHTCPVNPSY
jgi:amino acid permease